MRIVWNCDRFLYSSQLRLGLWSRVSRKAGCTLMTRRGWRLPDAVVFQKKFSRSDIDEAVQWKKRGVLTVFDINVNYFEWWGPIPKYLTRRQHEDAWAMAMTCDVVTTTSSYLAKVVSQRRQGVKWIQESIDIEHWRGFKRHEGPLKTLMLCAVADKMKDLEMIRCPLEKFARVGGRLLLVSEKKPELQIDIPLDWRVWDLKSAPETFLMADAQIAPRDLIQSYNMGHSLTKIAQGMLMGLPALASPVPSYEGKGCLTARSDDEWLALFAQLEDADLRGRLGEEGRERVVIDCDPEGNLRDFIRFLNQAERNPR